MTEPRDTNWPKPYLLEIYERARTDGCIRIQLHGDQERFRSLKAAFYRLRRRKDTQSVALMRDEYYLTSIAWEPDRGTALVIYNQLPDGQELPAFEAVEDKRDIPMPKPATPPPIPGLTTESEPSDFDAQAHVQKLLGNISFDEDGGDDELQ